LREELAEYELKVLCAIRNSALEGTSTTFGDIDGWRLQMPDGVHLCRQLLAHHAVLSHPFARDKGWSKQDLSEIEVKTDALMAHSHDKEAQERLRYLWRSAS
jgi:hypothetical protein